MDVDRSLRRALDWGRYWARAALQALPPLSRQQVIGWALVACSVLALLFSTITGIKAREAALCQQAAMAQDRATLRQMVADVFAAGEDMQARLQALERYLDTPSADDC